MKPWVLFLAVSFPVFAQFTDLVSTGDGRQLYFASTLQFAGAPASLPESRIYRIAENGLELFAERGALAATGTFASGYGARSPQVSTDGRTVGLILSGICPPGQSCISPGSQVELRGQSAMVLPADPLAFNMSRNGQWIVLTTTAGPPPINTPPQSTLINVTNGQRFDLPAQVPLNSLWPVASDGTVVLAGASAPGTSMVGLWRQGQFTPAVVTGPFSLLGISDDAGKLIYLQLKGLAAATTQSLVVRDLRSGADTVIFSRPAISGTIAAMGLSNDGRWLLYRAADTSGAGPAYLADTTTGQSTPVPLPDGELATRGTLSGDGNVAFLVTTAGRLFSVMSIAGATIGRTLIAPTPYVPNFPQLVPGSLTRLQGTLPHSAPDLAGRLFLGDVPLPVLFADDSGIGVQVPWETRVGQTAFHIQTPALVGVSPFQQNELVFTAPVSMRFEPVPSGQTDVFPFKAVRSDFSGLLTTPPHPGDIFIVYATGLGAVLGAVPTGQPAPLDHVLPIQGQFRCRFNPYPTDAEVLFAGLAPGFIGVYQINFRLPSGADPGPLTSGQCSWNSAGSSGGFGWISIPPP
jgi:uncharacterized protein (TIGR03437 family)